jgi:hypothetical protein
MTLPFGASLLWRAIWRSTLAGALVGGSYGAVFVFLTRNLQAASLGSDLLSGVFIGSMLGGFTGLVGGVLMGTTFLLRTRSSSQAPITAGATGLLAGLLAAALLFFALNGGRLGGLQSLNGFLLVGVPALLVLGWMLWEAKMLAMWLTRRRRAQS